MVKGIIVDEATDVVPCWPVKKNRTKGFALVKKGVVLGALIKGAPP